MCGHSMSFADYNSVVGSRLGRRSRLDHAFMKFRRAVGRKDRTTWTMIITVSSFSNLPSNELLKD